jgi:hypothetical protein
MVWLVVLEELLDRLAELLAARGRMLRIRLVCSGGYIRMGVYEDGRNGMIFDDLDD